MGCWRVLAGWALLSLLATAAPALADAELERKRTLRELVVTLEELGEWCRERQLYAQRVTVARKILEFDPDHEVARTWLKHRRTSEGGWVAPEPA